MRLVLAPKVVEVAEVEVAEAGVAAEVVDGVLGKGTSNVRESWYNFIKRSDNEISQSFPQRC
jgi:hypothetical protein